MTETSTKKILIAEDERPLARALALKLEKEGYTVTVATDGDMVLEDVEKETYDLVLMDIMMPHHDGFSLLADFKEKKMRTPVVVLSNLGQDSDKARAKELGAKDYFIKSEIKLSDIVAYVKKIVK